MVFSAFEREFRNIYGQDFDRSPEYISAKKDVVDLIDNYLRTTQGKKRSYIKQLRKYVENRDSSFETNIKKVLLDCEKIMTPFLKKRYIGSYPEMVHNLSARMGDFRNGIAHSRLDLHFEAIHLSDIKIVEELLYAATLFDNNGDKLAIYEAAMRQFPNDWRGFNDAGMILFETGKVAQAKADFEKANALSANNKTIKNNLGAVELINGNVKEAEVLFGAATGAGNEVNYNKGIVAIMKGDYKAAVDYFGKCNCVNAALANILAGNNNEAAKKLNEGKDDSALASYLKAVIAARNNDNSAVLSNLKTACSKDASMKKLAATDMEFAKLFDNADFQAIVK